MRHDDDDDDDDMLLNDSIRDENVPKVRKMKSLTMKMETLTLIGKGR
jgi:hypothetical protein